MPELPQPQQLSLHDAISYVAQRCNCEVANSTPQEETAAGLALSSGYFVFEANFGSVTFGAGTDPTFTTSASVPLGTVILGLIEGAASNSVQDATANSAALIVDSPGQPPPPPLPEPATLTLLGTALVGLGVALRRRRSV